MALVLAACGGEQDGFEADMQGEPPRDAQAQETTPASHFRLRHETPASSYVLDVIAPPVSLQSYAWETLEADGWRPLRDERPIQQRYFLGKNLAPALRTPLPSLACGLPLIDGKILLAPTEYLRVDDRPAPEGSDAGPGPLAVIEARDVTTPLRVRVTYFAESECTQQLVDLLELAPAI